jgi:hypothetical protein
MEPISMTLAYLVGKTIILATKNKDKNGEESKLSLAMDFIKTDQTENFIGTEIKRVDNRNNKVRLERNLKVFKEWTKTIQISIEKTETSSIETKLGSSLGLSKSSSITTELKSALEEKVSEHFQISRQEKQHYEESIKMEIPANESVELKIKWKQIWQCGYISLKNEETSEELSRIPFKYLEHITFDIE